MYANIISVSDKVPFEQGDTIPKLYGGFVELKSSHLSTFTTKLSEVIASRHKPDKEHSFKVAYAPLRTGDYHSDMFASAMSMTFPPLVVVIYLIPFMNFFQKALEEKVNRIKEYMRMMGMKDSAYNTSWIIYYTLQVLVVCIEMTVISVIFLTPHSNWILVFMFYFLYAASLFGWIISLVAIFNNVKTGSAAGIIIHFATFYIIYAVPKAASYSTRCLVSLLPNLALTQGAEILWKLEEEEEGLHFGTMGKTFKNYNMQTYFLMLFADFFIMIGVGLYLTYTMPTDYGLRKHPCFCLFPSFWKRKSKNRKRSLSVDLSQTTPIPTGYSYSRLSENQSLAANMDIDLEIMDDGNPNFERVPAHFKDREQLKVSNLVKVYENGVKAVDDLSLSMYKDQIFALLGPNGAGKTSTISMITGLYESTQGTAKVFGINIFEDMDKVREMLGVCPQHNVLFDQLSPKEHFEIFCEFKGVQMNIRRTEINSMLEEVDLKEQENLLSKNLSGGQKRKVNVGIALLGGSKLVLLDEPSSSLDPTARRRLWDMLKRHKHDRIIILTTHFMEEADILGDRIAIMSKGKASCCGSSLFLKKRFGVGYNLTIDKMDKERAPQIDAFIMARINNAVKLSEVSSEMTYQLPNDSIRNFKTFFKALDERKGELGLKSYGIGVTTLEEVFLKVCEGRMAALCEKDDYQYSINQEEDMLNDEYCLVDEAVTGLQLVRLQLYAMITIRLKLVFTQLRPFVFEVVYPSILIIFGALIMSLSMKSGNVVTTVDTSAFPVNQVFRFSQAENVSMIDSQSVVNQFFNSSPFTSVSESLTNESSPLRLMGFEHIIFEKHEADSNYGNAFFVEITKEEDKNKYDVLTFLDISSSAVLAYFTDFMNTALIRDSTGDPDLTLRLSYGSYPRAKIIDDWLTTSMAIMTVISFSLAVGNITSAMAANIVAERSDTVKHQQIISGASLFAYWASIFFVDSMKFFLPGSAFIVITYAMDFDVAYGWLLLILMIAAILPFTYCLTFIFRKESSARTVTSYIQFFMGGFMALIMFAFQVLDQGGVYIKILKWVLRSQPGFAFCNAIVQLTMKERVPLMTGDSIYSMKNVGGDMLFLFLMPFFYFAILFVIESGY